MNKHINILQVTSRRPDTRGFLGMDGNVIIGDSGNGNNDYIYDFNEYKVVSLPDWDVTNGDNFDVDERSERSNFYNNNEYSATITLFGKNVTVQYNLHQNVENVDDIYFANGNICISDDFSSSLLSLSSCSVLSESKHDADHPLFSKSIYPMHQFWVLLISCRSNWTHYLTRTREVLPCMMK